MKKSSVSIFGAFLSVLLLGPMHAQAQAQDRQAQDSQEQNSQAQIAKDPAAFGLFAEPSDREVAQDENEDGSQRLGYGGGFGAFFSNGAVYTQSNSPDGNRVYQYKRSPFGRLRPNGSFPTGGFGTGAGLGNQGAVTLSKNGNWLLVVNAGSDELSVFRVRDRYLVLTDIVDSGGDVPVSVTIHGHIVYVLNTGGEGNINGFYLDHEGRLSHLAGSMQLLSTSDATGAAQVGFDPTGTILTVTERATNQIDTFVVDEDGIAGPALVNASSGMTPFGFGFTNWGTLVISEAFGGGDGLAAVSSYDVGNSGELDVISASVQNFQSAACWILISKNNRFAYTTNTATDNVSGYAINPYTGELTLLPDPIGTAQLPEGSRPIDMALSRNGRYAYVLNGGTDKIAAFRVNRWTGRLIQIDTVDDLPEASNGLAAR